MSQHRDACRAYAEAYRTKLISKKLSADVKNDVDLYEEKLDLFNLLLIRNRIDLEVNNKNIFRNWLNQFYSFSKN